MNEKLEHKIKHIEGLGPLHLSLSKGIFLADSGKIFSLDLLASAVIKRSMSLCAGFSSMVRQGNYLCAASLLRLQLDSCLRFYAAFIVDEPHEMAHQVLKGVPIRKQKDKTGAFMTDKYLVDGLSLEHSWVSRVYDSTSGFIHLSERHIFSVIDSAEEEDTIRVAIGGDDKGVHLEVWMELSDAFLAATDLLFEYLKGWLYTKQNPHLASGKRPDDAG